MTGRILVLGAAGRFGHAAAEAFHHAGWDVTSLVRPGTATRAPRDTRVVEAHALDRAAVIKAAHGAEVVLHALNPVYTDWARLALPLAYGAIEAAETAGATLLFPGNVYNYGAGMPAVLGEHTPMRPTARKGQLRVQIEERLREAAERGMRTIILRAGDFYGGGPGSWFDLVVAKNLSHGRVTYPGPLDVMHEWAYLPDLAAAMVRLAAIRDTFGAFEAFGFPGHAVTGRELIAAIERALQRKLAAKQMTWWLVHTVGRLFSIGQELAEISYLWDVPHRIDGGKLKAAMGDVPATPFDAAIAATLRALGHVR